jgi:NAD(P)-dependent dehydrogenase (short-subunit alcohol dehydrogenase family)
MINIDLSGKCALVAGAGSGMGAACAVQIGHAGARVICVDVVHDAAQQVAQAIRLAGGKAVAAVADVRDRDEVRNVLADAVQPEEGLHFCVDVVGKAHWGALASATDHDWAESFAIVAQHVFVLFSEASAFAPPDGSDRSFVSISSISALTGAPQHGVYGAAKAALMSLTRTFAYELGGAKVRVNTVAPGSIRTPRRAAEETSPDRDRRVAEAVPLGRKGTPEDVAGSVLFLLSDLASYITGQTLVVDGGITTSFPVPL